MTEVLQEIMIVIEVPLEEVEMQQLMRRASTKWHLEAWMLTAMGQMANSAAKKLL